MGHKVKTQKSPTIFQKIFPENDMRKMEGGLILKYGWYAAQCFHPGIGTIQWGPAGTGLRSRPSRRPESMPEVPDQQNETRRRGLWGAFNGHPDSPSIFPALVAQPLPLSASPTIPTPVSFQLSLSSLCEPVPSRASQASLLALHHLPNSVS